MPRKKRNIRICVILLIFNVLFIWGNSLLPANASAALSGFIKKILECILPLGDGEPELNHGSLRKLAHFTEFASLGALLTWLYTMLSKRAVFLLPCSVLVACVDEFIQRFVPGRGASIIDVLIDSFGALLGICAVLAVHGLVAKKQKIDTKQS